jgi:hypothetical protein
MKKFIAATALVATIGVAGTTVAGTAAFANGGSDGNGRKNDQQVRGNRFERRHGNDSVRDMAMKKVADAHMKARHGHRGMVLGRHWLIQTAADAIGIDSSALRAQLHTGSSIAEVATANGVDPGTVVIALVTPLSNRLDEAVAKGKMTAEKVAKIKASLTERVTNFVNAKKTCRRPPRGAYGITVQRDPATDGWATRERATRATGSGSTPGPVPRPASLLGWHNCP